MAVNEKHCTLDAEDRPQNTPNGVAKAPFTLLAEGLSASLTVEPVDIRSADPSAEPENTAVRKRLKATDKGKQYLPGQPRIPLDTNQNHDHALKYLRKNHLTKELDDVLPFMKYIFVQTPSFRHINPLHHQAAHAREILVNEKPGLHLVWYYERIFVKPIPAYFYTTAFWGYISEADEDVFRTALGFMRSWFFLVQYEIDFDLACEKKLIPKIPETGERPTYEAFCIWLQQFNDEAVADADVNRRYHYGELRLSRINRTAMFFRGHLAYFHIYPQWGSVLSHMLAPVITIFAISSVVLESMQVNLNALQLVSPDSPTPIPPNWNPYVRVSLYFPVVVTVAIAAVVGIAISAYFIMGIKDVIKAKAVRHKKKHGDTHAGEKSHGMIW